MEDEGRKVKIKPIRTETEVWGKRSTKEQEMEK